MDRGRAVGQGRVLRDVHPLGAWLVTPDDIGDPQDLGIRLWGDGELRQDGHTGNMICPVRHIVRYLRQIAELDAGD
ncbi:fumarylacetoacetate hydrolase family protein [Streptomyces sp. NPDC086549]|uniref:fumarylacetoacetate hydrolase family protein n=1 Tax=Streptomyces sp. NPDC086549 TaxID=3365752 RepID=UPI003813EE8F